VLLDDRLPIGRTEPDVVINAYSIQVINAITTHDSETTEKLQMRGESVQVQLVKQFIMQLGLGSLIQGVIKKIKGGKSKPKPTEAEKADKKESYKLRIKEQQTQITTLTIKNRELETTVKELQSKQQTFIITSIVAAVIAIAAIIALFIMT
jgi:predicted RNase H-like nuclease (RuvC/YqgF family)